MLREIAKIGSSFTSEIAEIILTKKFWLTNATMILGCSLAAYAINSTVISLNLVSPGVTGVVVIIYYLTKLGNLSLIYLLINIPIFAIGWKLISPKFILINLLGTAYFTAALALTKTLPVPSAIADDQVLMIMWGAIVSGVGIGTYLRHGGSIGGMDIVAIVIKKKIGLPLSTTFNIVNIINLVCNYFIQDLRVCLFSALFMFSMTFVLMKTQTGFSQRLAVLIITPFHNQIAKLINTKLLRSSTLLKGLGSYSHKEQNIVYTVINTVELGRLKEIVHEKDPGAIVTVLGAIEVVGQRFISWEDQGYSRKKTRKKTVADSS